MSKSFCLQIMQINFRGLFVNSDWSKHANNKPLKCVNPDAYQNQIHMKSLNRIK